VILTATVERPLVDVTIDPRPRVVVDPMPGAPTVEPATPGLVAYVPSADSRRRGA
jgi:hypothetical protein